MIGNFFEGFFCSFIIFIIVGFFALLWVCPGVLAICFMDANWLWWYVLTIPAGNGVANVLNNL